MMFPGELADKKIEVLSGGERSRVMLGKIIATPANLLLLDEPTNHLDMQSIDSLCDAIDTFEGSTIMVTHSEMLLRRLADALIIFHKGGAEYFDGSYDDFLAKIGWEEEEGTAKPAKAKPKLDKKERKRLRSALIEEKAKEAKPTRDEIKFCEKRLEELEVLEEEQNTALETASNAADNAGMIEHAKALAKTQEEIEEMFERLEIASEALEKIDTRYEKKLAELV
jgi:ATP-binding cassette subfamily F protein 3